jgi:cyclopropane-fatty-acyl-phospholipid synthase
MNILSELSKHLFGMVESGYAPDAVIRAGIRSLNRKRLRSEQRGGVESLRNHQRSFIAMLRQSPIAVMTDAANEQHYELPPDFFVHVLGSRMKYSCCLYPAGTETLDQAEETMLRLKCERADIRDGMDILELGCGWGSLTHWMAEQYHGSRITAVSNSALQREFITALCRDRGIGNVEVITADMNHFDTEKRFDRVVSVEMFEHMRNYELLLRKVASWMKPDAKLFVHIFCHREYAYLFEEGGRTTGWGSISSAAASCPRTICCCIFRTTWRWRTTGAWTPGTASGPRITGSSTQRMRILFIRSGINAFKVF